MSSKNVERLAFAVFILFVVGFLLIAPYYLLPRINSARSEWLKNAPSDAVFLELWSIDTFEGGSASRARFLEKQAFSFQTKNKDTYVIVRSVELEQARDLLSQGTKPDMVSFGIGAGDLLESFCVPISSDCGVREDILSGSRKSGKILAVPWCMGGYVLCSENRINDLDSLLATQSNQSVNYSAVGTGVNYNLPKKALPKNIRAKVSSSSYTQYEAYESYLKGEFDILLGTQRDLFRLNNKSKLGLLDSINYYYLDTYTDLVQYLAVTVNSEEKRLRAEKFLKYITSETVQEKLTTIGMFCVNNAKIYRDKLYQEFEEALSKRLQVMNVFVSNVWLKEEQKQND